VGEDGLERVSGTEVKTHEGELPLDGGADLDQLEADRLADSLGEGGAGQDQAADRLEERVGQGGEEDPPLIGPPAVSADPIGE